MNRIAAYLNKNIIGEANTSNVLLSKFSQDGSILTNQPSVVIFPRHTDDIRKTTKFCNQLANKGMAINVCVRGFGNDTTGGAISDGAIVYLPKYFNRQIDFDSEQSLLHVQTGIDLKTINNLMSYHKLQLPLNIHHSSHSLGGVISNGLIYPFASGQDILFEMVDQLEIILASGDLLQTKRLSKREFNKKIGQSTPEAHIYRELDKLIEDNQELINTIDNKQHDNYGYNNIAKVKHNDGSFDLTPLFIGSQGTLGIISEAIVKLETMPNNRVSGIIALTDFDQAMDLSDELLKQKPTELNIFDANLFELARNQGNFFDYYQKLEADSDQDLKFLIYFEFGLSNRFSANSKANKLISLSKKYSSQIIIDDKIKIESINDLAKMFDFIETSTHNTPLIEGVKIPRVEWRNMLNQLIQIRQATNQPLPFYGSLMTDVVNFYTKFDLNQVSHKQAALKLIEQFRRMTEELHGVFCASGGEGQLKSFFMYKHINPDLIKLYQEIKHIFDPNNILNSNSKQQSSLQDIATKIKNYDGKYYQ